MSSISSHPSHRLLRAAGGIISSLSMALLVSALAGCADPAPPAPMELPTARLASLSIVVTSNNDAVALMPTFKADTLKYTTATVDSTVSSVTVTATGADDATVTITATGTGASATGNVVALADPGSSTTIAITISATRENIADGVYTVTVPRDALIGTDAVVRIDGTAVANNGTVEVGSQTGSVGVALELVDGATATVTSTGGTVTANASDRTAPLVDGMPTTITIVVSAEGDSATYTVTVARDAQSAQIGSFTIETAADSGSFTAVDLADTALFATPFDSATSDYTLLVASGVAQVKFTPVLKDRSATITVETTSSLTGDAATDGEWTVGIQLDVITVTFTAMINSMSMSYQFEIRRNGDGDSDGIVDADDMDNDGDGLIEIWTLDQLDNMRHNLAGTSYDDESADSDTGDAGDSTGCPPVVSSVGGCTGYELMNDLDFADADGSGSGTDAYDGASGDGNWRPVGTFGSLSFIAIFNGNGYVISGMRVVGSHTHAGFFGGVGANGRVINLTLVDAQVKNTTNSIRNTGLLVGLNAGQIIACGARGGIANSGDLSDTAGGLVGRNEGSIVASWADVSINAGGGTDSVGGLTGWNRGGNIIASWASGSVNGEGEADSVGGLVGTINSSASVVASWSDAVVDGGSGTDDVGALSGILSTGTIIASYGFGGTVQRSSDATTGVTMLSALTQANSSTTMPNRWSPRVWQFGGQAPALKWVTGYDGSQTGDARFPLRDGAVAKRHRGIELRRRHRGHCQR